MLTGTKVETSKSEISILLRYYFLPAYLRPMYAARPAQPDRITSLQNPRIKEVLRLQDKAAERRRQGLTLVEGYRELGNARQAGWQVATLLVCEELAGEEITQQLVEPSRLVPRPYEYLPVSAAVFAKLAVRERSDGVLALLRTPSRTLTDLELPENPLVLVLEAVEKPGNLGAILRTADAAPAHAVLVGDPRTDLYNPNGVFLRCPRWPRPWRRFSRFSRRKASVRSLPLLPTRQSLILLLASPVPPR
jgi:hypothetical protein